MRADELLVRAGLAPSRAKARALIEEGKVFYLSKPVDKPSRSIPEGASLEVDADCASLRFVSRAGLKLEAFLERFGVGVEGVRALDVGASTGGFTDCLLSRGAAECVCVDVGHGQLSPKLAADSRVSNMEGTDVRSLTPALFGGRPFDFACADLSFISLTKALPAIMPLVGDGAPVVCLVKPQFEADPALMRKCAGVLRDPAARRAALEKVEDFFSENFPSATPIGSIPSPILGGDGNAEFLIGYRK